MFKKILFATILSIPLFLAAQQLLGDKYSFTYEQVPLDKRIPLAQNSALQGYYDSIKEILNQEMGIVVGEALVDLPTFSPQSPLSNLLADMVFDYADSISATRQLPPIDLAILNFGGIRTDIQKGPITLGQVYSVLSFDNMIVTATLTGSDVKKLLKRFTAKSVQVLSHAKIVYLGNHPTEILVGGKKIDEDRLYRVATLDFLAFSGGDGIFDGIQLSSIYETHMLLRDLFLQHIVKHKQIHATVDDRIVIRPQM